MVGVVRLLRLLLRPHRDQEGVVGVVVLPHRAEEAVAAVAEGVEVVLAGVEVVGRFVRWWWYTLRGFCRGRGCRCR